MPSSPTLGVGAGSSPAPKRALSLRKSLEKVGEVLHLHKEPSARKLFIPDAKHGCRSEEEAKALRHLLDDLQAQNITLPPDMIYAGDLDATLLRFLRARKLDNDATVAMLKGGAPIPHLQGPGVGGVQGSTANYSARPLCCDHSGCTPRGSAHLRSTSPPRVGASCVRA
jgi:hypothetical protein